MSQEAGEAKENDPETQLKRTRPWKVDRVNIVYELSPADFVNWSRRDVAVHVCGGQFWVQ